MALSINLFYLYYSFSIDNSPHNNDRGWIGAKLVFQRFMYTPFNLTNVRFIHEPSLPLLFSFSLLTTVRHDKFQAW